MNFSRDYFIDVNGFLQNSIMGLREVFQPECIFHLIRDGRKVVRSIYTRRSDKNIHLIPKNREEVEMWLAADKFKQVCWNWTTTTLNLYTQGTKLIKFEEITKDYEYLKVKFLDPFGFELPCLKWQNFISKKKNKTRSKLYRYLYTKLRK